MTPVEELFNVLWDMPKDKFRWHAVRNKMLEKEKEIIKEVYWDGGQDMPLRESDCDNYYKLIFNTTEICKVQD